MVADSLTHKLRLAVETGRLLADKVVRESAELDGRREELRAEKKLLAKIEALVAEAKLSEAKGEAAALLHTLVANTNK